MWKKGILLSILVASFGCGTALEIDASLESIQENIFDVSCTSSSCHGAAASGGLDLRSNRAYDELVEVSAQIDPTLDRVVPGSPETSLLYLKLTGDLQDQGSRMPLGGIQLSLEKIEAVRLWIANGAAPANEENDSGSTDTGTDGGTGTSLDGTGTGSGSGTGGSTGSDSGSTTGGDSGSAAPATFSEIQSNIFNGTCTGCHGSSGGLNLNASVAYDNLVNITGNIDSSIDRVSPSDPDNSLLYLKVTSPGSGQGSRMPRGRSALSNDDVEMIRSWIADGAQDN